jgi:hypothetical protein
VPRTGQQFRKPVKAGFFGGAFMTAAGPLY